MPSAKTTTAAPVPIPNTEQEIVMLARLVRLTARAYDYCEACGWWVKNCPHQ